MLTKKQKTQIQEVCEQLAAVLSEVGGKGEGVWVMADEIYERITYDTPHEAFACLPGMWERTMTVRGPGGGKEQRKLPENK